MNITVSSLVRYLKNKLDNDENIQNITVKGEISNFHKHNSGHFYFTLKDEKASISCVMFSSKTYSLKFEPKNGDKVLANANVSIFESSGQMQLYINSMMLDGVGDLFQKYEILKNKLYSEGLFDENHKKQIPAIFPERVAVLVGENSAAMSDIKICFKRRWPLTNVDFYPCLVQGNDAPNDIIEKLKEVDKKNYQIIVLARGGGSFEDLFCFNDEQLARTIYNLKTFIVTGIGHEQDFTIADFVADLRAATPTAAIELITPNINDIIEQIDIYQDTLITRINELIKDKKEKLNILKKNRFLQNPHKIIDEANQKLMFYENKIKNYSKNIEIIKQSILNYKKNFNTKIINLIKVNKIKIDKYDNLLKAYSYENTLKRGYSIVYKDNKIIKSIKEININDDLNIKIYDGNINALVKEKTND